MKMWADGAATWTSRSWRFTCRDATAASGAQTALRNYDKIIGLGDQKLSVANVKATSVTTANGASVRIRYASNTDILTAIVEGGSLDEAVAGAEAVLAALVKNHRPS